MNRKKPTRSGGPPVLPRKGYFLGQEAASVSKNWPMRRRSPYFHFCVPEDRAKRYFDHIAGKVDGLDYVNYWLEPADADDARKIAEMARAVGIDMWAGIRYFKQFRVMPPVPADCVAYTMDDSGRIAFQMFEQRRHLFDPLNPAAVDWYLDVLEDKYWPHMKGAVNGYFFPETSLGGAGIWEGGSVQVWKQPAYSPYTLQQWQNYCAEHDVRHKGAQVDRFPVPRRYMAEPHPDKTIHVGDDRPESLPSFTRFADIPRGPEVWLAWEDFLCQQFHENFLHRICERLNRYHAEDSDWRGNCLFCQDWALTDYRNYKTRSARTGIQWRYWPQGRRVGIDTRRLFADPHITCFIAETIPSVRDYYWYEENFLSHGMDFAREHGAGDRYGFMVHYDDSWSGPMQFYHPSWVPIMDDIEEDLRWEMIHKYRPPVFSYYSIPRDLVKGGAWHNQEAADRFWHRVVEYKASFDG